jgi:hypothetical protein
MRDDHARIIRDLYASEINTRIEWFYDGGFSVSLGDMLSEWRATNNLRTFAEAVDWVRAQAIKRYPKSAFRMKYRPPAGATRTTVPAAATTRAASSA